ncbi:MAG: hypothetical protein IJ583_06000 [Firmicutes bacterium]|nr:hypothetical protein [Bacillota bacterium]
MNSVSKQVLTPIIDFFGLKKGSMLSFNFNKNEEIGVKDVVAGDRVIVEAVV